MKNKHSLYIIGIIITSFLIIQIVAWMMKIEYLELGQLQNPAHFATLYQAMVLKNYDTLTYLTIGLSVCIVLGFGWFAGIKNQVLKWILGLLIGVVFFLSEAFYLVYYFNEVL